jgi:NAD(P)-dependent dehydrogenase (short-subunit alcohol dehydrogenase family)
LAELLATTRLVGMRCPGLHSLFGGLALSAMAAADPPAPSLTWEVAGARLPYSKLALRVRGTTLAGTLDVFLRPAPLHLAMSDALRAVPRASFAGWRALVVGGSRGLGEAFSLAIGAGGGDVCLTYHRGATDAERIAADLRAAGRRAAAIQHDVLASAPLRWPWPDPPTHLFYLAAPTLHSIRKGAPFRSSELELLFRYFVFSLHTTASSAAALGARPLVVWTPSTTMLDAPAGGAAYCAAKAAMEELCRHLPALLPAAAVTVHAPRLGRVDTDQTASLIALPPAPALDAAVSHLRRLV